MSLNLQLRGKLAVILFVMAAMAATCPARALPGCTNEDINLATAYAQRGLQALVAGNVMTYVQLMQELETRLSPACLAQSAGQKMRNGCSKQERNFILSSIREMFQIAVYGGDLGRYLQIAFELNSSLSPACQAALAQIQQAGGGGGNGSLPGVMDHGGGTFSVPGLGACVSGGCMSFD